MGKETHQLEQKFIREERNQIRNNRKKKMFTDLTKVQINSERNVTLAIRITENHVHNLIFEIETFAHIMNKDVQNWYGLIHGRYWKLQKLSDRVKLFDERYEYIYRFSIEEWKFIKKQFIKCLKKDMLQTKQ